MGAALGYGPAHFGSGQEFSRRDDRAHDAGVIAIGRLAIAIGVGLMDKGAAYGNREESDGNLPREQHEDNDRSPLHCQARRPPDLRPCGERGGVLRSQQAAHPRIHSEEVDSAGSGVLRVTSASWAVQANEGNQSRRPVP